MAKSLVTDLIGEKIEWQAWVKELGERSNGEPSTTLWCQIIRHLNEVGTVRAVSADKDGDLIIAARFGYELVSGIPACMFLFSRPRCYGNCNPCRGEECDAVRP